MISKFPEKRESQVPEESGDGATIALDEDDLYGREEAREKSLQFIVFRVAREWYGVDITKVKEVIKTGRITYLPSGPEHIAGIVNLRGNILSVLDLGMILRLDREAPGEKKKIIAIESGFLQTGFLVDEVVDSIEVPVRRIEPPLLTIPSEGEKYIEGQCMVNDRLVAFLNVEKILEKKA